MPTLPTQPKPSVLTNTLTLKVSDATSRKPVVDEGAVERAATGCDELRCPHIKGDEWA